MNFGSPDSQKKNILIIDDDTINRMVLRSIFSPFYNVSEAENGTVGLNVLLTPMNKFCAVLLDVNMPGISGIDVLRTLYERGMLEKLPVFLITSETGEVMTKEAYEMGVMDVIKKPVVPFVVLRRVGSVIELFETRASLREVVQNQQAELLEQANKIIQLNQGMIEALATAIEFRNEESGGHVQRISQITRYMLENTEFGQDLAQSEVQNIALAAIMHDVGKITIPDAILTKPGRFTAEEYEIMKTHTTKGVLILDRIPQLKDSGVYEYARDIAMHHHERWDGGGYPDGLKGDEITPWAQVVSLVDVYDALSCKRVYKASYSRERVIEMIRDGECGVFNPKLVEDFMTIEEHVSMIYHYLPEAENF